ncbi:MAG TPA: cytochrome c biogenesis protein CcsA [Chitinophagaceae bacterium]|nr:cytochrome c biogenesis protein CcsA [Chitinophagaceae bacterium]
MLRQNWWKILSFVLLLIAFIAGFLGDVPAKPILNETIRNLYFHVAMWFCMMILFLISLVNSIKYLRTNNIKYDWYALEYAQSGIVFGVLGLLTGMIWANYTWGKPWSNDPKQLGAAIALLIYFAYLVLRNSLTDEMRRAKTSAVYNIFAFAMLIPTIWVIPRLMESLHPGGMGNPALNTNDIDSRMRMIFWPAAVPGWVLLGVWITTLRIRLRAIADKKLNA